MNNISIEIQKQDDSKLQYHLDCFLILQMMIKRFETIKSSFNKGALLIMLSLMSKSDPYKIDKLQHKSQTLKPSLMEWRYL